MDYTGYLTTTGFIVPIRTLQLRFGNKYSTFLSRLVITYVRKKGIPKRAKLYTDVVFRNVRALYLPRTYMKLLLDGKILNKIEVSLAAERVIIAPMHIGLYENQTIAVKWLRENIFTNTRITNGTATCIFNLRAGTGKTFVAAGLISSLGLRTLYIVPKKPLASQAIRDLRACMWSETGRNPVIERYGSIKKSSPKLETHDITVIVINSAVARDEEFFRGYSLVILDEVHSYCTDCWSCIFRKCSSRAMFGMSATTEDRTDGFDAIAHKELAFDGIIRAENVPGFNYPDDCEFNCQARVICYSGPSEYTQHLTHESTGSMFTHYMHNQFASDPYRTKHAVNELIELYDWRGGKAQKHNIYVFAEEIEILRTLLAAVQTELKNRGRDDIIIDAPELGLFTGGLTEQAAITMVAGARVLFTTYGYSGTGISIVKMTAILFFTGRRANMKQILARILRLGSDVDIPRVVVDFVDKKTAMGCQFGDRKLAYDFYGFKINYVPVKWTDLL